MVSPKSAASISCGTLICIVCAALVVVATSCPSGFPLTPRATALYYAAKEVLSSNWIGHSTRPGPILYPHQGSWVCVTAVSDANYAQSIFSRRIPANFQDSAFIAIGKAVYDQEEAQLELETLFDAQWSNGFVPHIVYNNETTIDYFPGPEFWNSMSNVHAPLHVNTSGCLHPPVHATAALAIYNRANATARPAALSFLERIYPKLDRWHHFLAKERSWNHLVWIRHPWESGMSNSPLWDDLLHSIVLKPGDIPPYNRTDIVHSNATDLPSKDQYDRYVWLALQAKQRGYDESKWINSTLRPPFQVVDVLFNSLYLRAQDDLIKIAVLLNKVPDFHKAERLKTEENFLRYLWDEHNIAYRNYNVVLGNSTHVDLSLSASAFAPLFARVVKVANVSALVTHWLNSTHFSPSNHLLRLDMSSYVFTEFTGLDGAPWPVASFDRSNKLFLPHNSWRGPIWANINWVLYKGLAQYSQIDQRAKAYAEFLHNATLSLVEQSGFHEFHDPLTGLGHGSHAFSWTASLVIDMLCQDA